MKLLFIALFLVLLALTPVVLVGSKYRDGVFTDNTYVKSLDYDEGRKISAESGIRISEPVCSAGLCKSAFSLDIAPDSNSLTARVFRPAGKEELLLEAGAGYLIYKFKGDGWYILRLDYSKNGVWASEEKSFYIKAAV